MEALGEFLLTILGEAVSWLILGLVIYPFKLKADSRRDRLVMAVTVVAYLLFLGMQVYWLGSQTGGCAGCGGALIVSLGVGLVIAIAGVRMYLGRKEHPVP